MELTRVTKLDLNIASEAEVLSYTYTGSDPREVIARVDLGTISKPITGGGTYVLKFYIDGVLITPNSSIAVPSGVTQTIMVSRQIPLDTNDVVSIAVDGLIGDVAVDTVSTLRDATPIRQEDVTGDGSEIVDHDYGGPDALAYKTGGGVGVANAVILVYLLSDYDNGDRTEAFLVAKTTTVVGGKWAFSLRLDPEDYTLIYYKTGEYGPDRKDITVS